MHILVTSNLSAGSSRAVERAFQLAADSDAALRILHVVDEDGPPALREQAIGEAQRHLRAEAERASAWSGIEASIEVVAGSVRRETAIQARQFDADLIVMGEHHPDRRRPGAFSHTLAGAMLAELGRPLLLAKEPVNGAYPAAVVGIDLSVFSKTALRAARRFAPQAVLHLVHAYEVPFKSWLTDAAYAEDYAYAERLEFDEYLAEEMQWLEKRAVAAGIPVEFIRSHLHEGKPTDALRALLKKTGAPLAVIGTHGRSGIARLLLGSVAANLVDDPPADLLVVPMAIPAKARA
ncbi:universal stress protein [Sandaracinobacteroides sp. A072]|uniref:universal stress protein n=1 Tax=Sandaracinobacteroides sp. A072 TaxID=3461146 RepID=UPI004042BF07